ncbi:MAG: hypothetical protein Kow0092_03200 [Deferrisomatales bacterium]
MAEPAPAHVRLLGCLHTWMKDRGRPDEVAVPVAPEGEPALEVARRLELPLDRIEAVFVNRICHDLAHPVRPGDRVAFVPQGTPGPHRFTLGIHHAGTRHPGSSPSRN